MAIQIDLQKCVGCGMCVPICPLGLLEMVDMKVRLKEEGCNFCGACRDICTFNAIIIDGDS
jgi:Fe-S-cluster-containing hydrogenase component 2